MSTYCISVLNASGFAKGYVLFMPPPTVTSRAGPLKFATHAWVAFDGVLSGGVSSISYTDAVFAYWSTVPVGIAPGTSVGQCGHAAVTVAQRDGVAFIAATAPGFGPLTPHEADSGCFRIVTAGDFDAAHGYQLGLAKPGNVPGIPTAVSTFAAAPNDTFDIKPSADVLVADGVYQPGEVVDRTDDLDRVAVVSFTGRSRTRAIVTQGSDGRFGTIYY